MSLFKIKYKNLEKEVNYLESYRKKLLIKSFFLNIISKVIFFYLLYLYSKDRVDLKGILNIAKKIIMETIENGLDSIVERIVTFFQSGGLEIIIKNMIDGFNNLQISTLLILMFAVIILNYMTKYLDIIIFYPLNFFFNYNLSHKKFYTDYKKKVVSNLISSFGEELNYFPNRRIEEELFLESNLYDGPFYSYEGDDYVDGYIDKTKIMFSELNILQKSSNEEVEKTFQGLLFIADFNKEFSYKTIVRAKEKFKISELVNYVIYNILINYKLFFFIGVFISAMLELDLIQSIFIIIIFTIIWIAASKIWDKIIAPSLHRARLENEDFQNLYDVYGENEQELRYLLTPKIMEKLVNLQLETKNEISISFVNSKIFIAIPLQEPLFEANVFQPIEKSIKEHYQLLELIIGIAEDLDLNTRIWTKE